MTTIKQLNLLESQAMTASFNSSEVDVSQFVGFSIQCVYTGSPNGSLKIQVSNDQEDPTNWDDLDNSTVTITTSGSETYIVGEVFYNFIRLVYTFSSGSGTFNAKFVAKD